MSTQPPTNIDVQFERDVACRLTEVQIINSNREGRETQGVIVRCHDDGTITIGEDPWPPDLKLVHSAASP